MRGRPLILAIALLGSLWLGACSKKRSPQLQVAAAASLAGAFGDVAKAFTEKTGTEVSLILSSSGKLSQQIREGAPFDVFASANLGYLRQLAKSGDVLPASLVSYARGRLVMWVKHGTAPASLAQLDAPAFEHIAIANPEHAPYGMAARQALQRSGLWDRLKDHVVRGSNVRQAMQYAESDNAEVALIAQSLAISAGGAFAPVDPHLHDPLIQAIGVVSATSRPKQAAAFIEFLQSPQGTKLLRPYGLEAASDN